TTVRRRWLRLLTAGRMFFGARAGSAAMTLVGRAQVLRGSGFWGTNASCWGTVGAARHKFVRATTIWLLMTGGLAAMAPLILYIPGLGRHMFRRSARQA